MLFNDEMYAIGIEYTDWQSSLIGIEKRSVEVRK